MGLGLEELEGLMGWQDSRRKIRRRCWWGTRGKRVGRRRVVGMLRMRDELFGAISGESSEGIDAVGWEKRAATRLGVQFA